MEQMMTATTRSTCPYFESCLREGHASAICLINSGPKFQRCKHRPDWQEAEMMQTLGVEVGRLMRMELDELIEERLTRYAVEAESPELKSEIRACLQRIADLAE